MPAPQPPPYCNLDDKKNYIIIQYHPLITTTTAARYDLAESMVNWLKVMLGIFNVGLDVCFEPPSGGAVTSGGWLDHAATSYAEQRQCAEDSLRWNWEHYPKVSEHYLPDPFPPKKDLRCCARRRTMSSHHTPVIPSLLDMVSFFVGRALIP